MFVIRDALAASESPLRLDQAWMCSFNGAVLGLVNSTLTPPPGAQGAPEWWFHVLAAAVRATIMPPENARALDAGDADWDAMFEELHGLARQSVTLIIDGVPVACETLEFCRVRFALATDYSRWPVVVARPAHHWGPWPDLQSVEE